MSLEQNAKRRKVADCPKSERKFIQLNPMKRLSYMSSVVVCLKHGITKLGFKDHISSYSKFGPRFEFDNDDFCRDHAKTLKRSFLQEGIPKELLPKLFDVAKFMICEFSYWFDSMPHCTTYSYKNMDEICWSTTGTIDYCATVRRNTLNSKLCKRCKYVLACSLCLEDDIAKLVTPDVLTRYFNSLPIDERPMVYFWSSYLSRNDVHLIEMRNNYNRNFDLNLSTNAFVFQKVLDMAAYRECSSAIAFMWEKLTDSEKNNFIAPVLKGIISMDVKYHALSEMPFEQQRQVLSAEAGEFLSSLFYSHYRDENFLTTANLLWNMISEEDFFLVLNDVVIEIDRPSDFLTNTTEIYAYFFRELWYSAPNQLKLSVFNYQNSPVVEEIFWKLASLNWTEHFDLVEKIFEYATQVQKKAILCLDCFLQKFKEILKNDWEHFDKCMSVFNLSDEDLNVLKRKLEKNCNFDVVAIDYAKKLKWDHLDQLVEWVPGSAATKATLREKVALHFFRFWTDECCKKNVEFSIPEDHLKRCFNSEDVYIDYHPYCLRDGYVLNICTIDDSDVGDT